MKDELSPLDVTSIPELDRLVEEVNASGRPRRLCRGSKEVAVLMPSSPRVRRARERTPSQADIDAFLSSAGAWKDVDTDALIADIYESRRSSRSPVRL